MLRIVTRLRKERDLLGTTLSKLAGGLPTASQASLRSMPLTSCLLHRVNGPTASFASPAATLETVLALHPQETTQRHGVRRFTCKSAANASEAIQSVQTAQKEAPRSRPAVSRRAKQVPDASTLKALTNIPGVGIKNAQLLKAAGYADQQAVEKYFLEECSRDKKQFLNHLKDHVGIKSNRNKALIAEYMKNTAKAVPSELSEESIQEDGMPRLRCRNNVTLSVEGNISAGKSTFLKGITDHCPDLQSLMHVSPEPVDRWQNLNAATGETYNLLDKFYEDKERFAYIFQHYIFYTRMMQEKESSKSMANQPYRLLERSVFCDRMVFVESLRDSNFMSEMELTIYDSWFDPIVELCSTLVPDGFIYLRAQPDTCMNRMRKRSRQEETAVGIDYLQDLHQRHETWLNSELRKGDDLNRAKHIFEGSRAVLDPSFQGFLNERQDALNRRMKQVYEVPKLPDLISGDVRFLNKDRNSLLHSSIHSLPALVLDCEKDIRDLDAQREHAEKVNCYFQYVRETRKQRAINRWLEGSKLPEELLVRDNAHAIKMAADGLKRGVGTVPEEWRLEVTQQIDEAVKVLQLNVDERPQLVI